MATPAPSSASCPLCGGQLLVTISCCSQTLVEAMRRALAAAAQCSTPQRRRCWSDQPSPRQGTQRPAEVRQQHTVTLSACWLQSSSVVQSSSRIRTAWHRSGVWLEVQPLLVLLSCCSHWAAACNTAAGVQSWRRHKARGWDLQSTQNVCEQLQPRVQLRQQSAPAHQQQQRTAQPGDQRAPCATTS